jgi:hypothetical protein
MHLRFDETITHNRTERSVAAYKLYNLVFSGKISLQEYLRFVQMLKNNEGDGREPGERKNGI